MRLFLLEFLDDNLKGRLAYIFLGGGRTSGLGCGHQVEVIELPALGLQVEGNARLDELPIISCYDLKRSPRIKHIPYLHLMEHILPISSSPLQRYDIRTTSHNFDDWMCPVDSEVSFLVIISLVVEPIHIHVK